MRLLFPKAIQALCIIVFIAVSFHCQKKLESACNTGGLDTIGISLDSLIGNIEIESKNFVSMKELRKSKSFTLLFDNPELYQNEILKCISTENKPLTYKAWCVESQCKCDDVYFEFSKKVLEKFKKGEIDEKLLFTLLAPANSSTLPFLKKENKRFRMVLQDIKRNQPISPDLQSFIADIESGYVLDNWQLYY